MLSQECVNIRNLILESIRLTEEKLQIKKDAITKVDCFLCFCSGESDDHVCTYNTLTKTFVECIKRPGKVFKLESRHLKWLGKYT